MSGFINRHNLLPKFGRPVFVETEEAGLSDGEIDTVGADKLYLLAVGAANTAVKVNVWGKVQVERLITTDAETSAPTTAPPGDTAFEEADVWVFLGDVDLDVAASEVNSPEEIVPNGLRGEMKSVDVQAVSAVKLELVSADHPVTIWAAGAQAGF